MDKNAYCTNVFFQVQGVEALILEKNEK